MMTNANVTEVFKALTPTIYVILRGIEVSTDYRN